MRIRTKQVDFFTIPALLLWSLMCWSGCLSEIDLEVPQTNSPSIAIRGNLMAAEVSSILVKITKVSDFRKFEIPEAVVGATVVLTDEANHSLVIPMQAEGVYELSIPDNTYELEVRPGKSYQLSVTTNDGQSYRSTVEPLFPVPVLTAVEQLSETRKIINESGNLVDQKFLRFLITTPIVNATYAEKAHLKWSFVGTYKFRQSLIESPFPPDERVCYFFEDLNLEKVVVFNGEESDKQVLSQYFLLEEPYDYRFAEGFYLSIFQQSLSEGAYQYWDKVGKIVDLSGTFFEAPPGKVKGNFHNINDATEEVFGYFYATQETVFRYFIPAGEDRVMPFCPLSVANPDAVPGVCLDCLSRPGSTLVKPDFWEE